MTIQAVRGMKDVLPPEVYQWQYLEATARRVFAAFGFKELRIPVLERTELFARSIGESTDIVEKEMYTFSDRSGDSLTLRPEATAGVLRAYIEHKVYARPGPHKFFFIGPMFRHERPQKGRLRQFHQIDCEVLADDSPQCDAELLVMLSHLLQRLGLEEISIVLNSLGCPRCRPGYRQALLDYLQARQDELCDDCRRRLASNPLRVLDCKSEGCRQASAGAPVIAQHWCPDCRAHHQQVKELLELAGVAYREDPRLVRGLDYYLRTTFEAVTGRLGAQNAVAGGGRYDGLIQALGGPDQGGSGFALGLERLALLVPQAGEPPRPRLFIAALGHQPRLWAFARAQELRSRGVWVEMTSQDKSLKAQMRRAHKLGASRVLIVGGRELESGRAVLKDMDRGDQQEVALARIGSLLPQAGE